MLVDVDQIQGWFQGCFVDDHWMGWRTPPTTGLGPDKGFRRRIDKEV